MKSPNHPLRDAGLLLILGLAALSLRIHIGEAVGQLPAALVGETVAGPTAAEPAALVPDTDSGAVPALEVLGNPAPGEFRFEVLEPLGASSAGLEAAGPAEAGRVVMVLQVARRGALEACPAVVSARSS